MFDNDTLLCILNARFLFVTTARKIGFSGIESHGIVGYGLLATKKGLLHAGFLGQDTRKDLSDGLGLGW